MLHCVGVQFVLLVHLKLIGQLLFDDFQLL